MITLEKQAEVQRTAERLFAEKPDWITFYREVLGLHGIVRRLFPTREALLAFKQTDSYRDILQLLTKLRQNGPMSGEGEEPTRVITVRLPKSMHEALRVEAFEHRTSMNKLCISKLLEFIENEKVPTET
ncbi:MAG: toxin-antitoxin system HicB family antitoxin [Thermoguttaceae bacterium]